jgi:hypothetical protein
MQPDERFRRLPGRIYVRMKCDGIRIEDVPDVFDPAGREVIDDGDLMAFGGKCFREM